MENNNSEYDGDGINKTSLVVRSTTILDIKPKITLFLKIAPLFLAIFLMKIPSSNAVVKGKTTQKQITKKANIASVEKDNSTSTNIGTIIDYRPKPTYVDKSIKVSRILREVMGDDAASFIQKTRDSSFIQSMEKLARFDIELDSIQLKNFKKLTSQVNKDGSLDYVKKMFLTDKAERKFLVSSKYLNPELWQTDFSDFKAAKLAKEASKVVAKVVETPLRYSDTITASLPALSSESTQSFFLGAGFSNLLMRFFKRKKELVKIRGGSQFLPMPSGFGSKALEWALKRAYQWQKDNERKKTEELKRNPNPRREDDFFDMDENSNSRRGNSFYSIPYLKEVIALGLFVYYLITNKDRLPLPPIPNPFPNPFPTPARTWKNFSIDTLGGAFEVLKKNPFMIVFIYFIFKYRNVFKRLFFSKDYRSEMVHDLVQIINQQRSDFTGYSKVISDGFYKLLNQNIIRDEKERYQLNKDLKDARERHEIAEKVIQEIRVQTAKKQSILEQCDRHVAKNEQELYGYQQLAVEYRALLPEKFAISTEKAKVEIQNFKTTNGMYVNQTLDFDINAFEEDLLKKYHTKKK